MAKKLSIYAGLVARLASLSKGAILTHFVDRALDGGTGEVTVYDLREDLNIDGEQVLADLRGLQEAGWLTTAPPTADDLEDAGYFPVVADRNPHTGARFQGLRIRRCVIECEVVWKVPEKQKELDFGPATVSVKFNLGPQGGQGEPLPRGVDTGVVSTRSVADEVAEAVAETLKELDSAEEGPTDAWLRWLAEQVLYEEGDGPYLIRLKSDAHAQAVEALGGVHVQLASGAEVELVVNDFLGLLGPEELLR